MSLFVKILLFLGLLVGAVIGGFFVWRALIPGASPRPTGLGVMGDGRLAPCPDSPNCVNTSATDKLHQIDPITFSGQPDVARATLLNELEKMAGVTIITADDSYIYAEFRTPRMGFIDDVEFLIDAPVGVIQMRSASRLGYGDQGANRARLEAIRVLIP